MFKNELNILNLTSAKGALAEGPDDGACDAVGRWRRPSSK
jgi:hypothetical protein